MRLSARKRSEASWWDRGIGRWRQAVWGVWGCPASIAIAYHFRRSRSPWLCRQSGRRGGPTSRFADSSSKSEYWILIWVQWTLSMHIAKFDFDFDRFYPSRCTGKRYRILSSQICQSRRRRSCFSARKCTRTKCHRKQTRSILWRCFWRRGHSLVQTL